MCIRDRSGTPQPAAGSGPSGSAPGGAQHGHRAHPGPSAADWTALRRDLSPAMLIRPGEQGYRRARLLFDPRFDHLRPAGIAYCRSAADVLSLIHIFADQEIGRAHV